METNELKRLCIISYARLGIAGLSPIMPGSCGSLIAAILAPWLFIPFSTFTRVLILIFIFWTGSLVGTIVEQLLQKKDPKEVVIDELLGLWVVLLPFKNPGWIFIGLAFILFRIFDIIKIWPVNASETWLPGGYGIMIDDVVAGLQALLIISILYWTGYLNQWL